MKGTKLKEYKIWLEKANDDLKWTKANLKEEVYYGACFTAQQAVEKALKAYLLYKQGRFDKVHDLKTLLDNCATYDQDFTQYQTRIVKLSFYYMQTRYPDISEIDKFTEEEAKQALAVATEFIEFATNKIKGVSVLKILKENAA